MGRKEEGGEILRALGGMLGLQGHPIAGKSHPVMPQARPKGAQLTGCSTSPPLPAAARRARAATSSGGSSNLIRV